MSFFTHKTIFTVNWSFTVINIVICIQQCNETILECCPTLQQSFAMSEQGLLHSASIKQQYSIRLYGYLKVYCHNHQAHIKQDTAMNISSCRKSNKIHSMTRLSWNGNNKVLSFLELFFPGIGSMVGNQDFKKSMPSRGQKWSGFLHLKHVKGSMFQLCRYSKFGSRFRIAADL